MCLTYLVVIHLDQPRVDLCPQRNSANVVEHGGMFPKGACLDLVDELDTVEIHVILCVELDNFLVVDALRFDHLVTCEQNIHAHVQVECRYLSMPDNVR